jgi:hypothetical protein
MALSLFEAKRRDRVSIPLSSEDDTHIPNDISLADQDTRFIIHQSPLLNEIFPSFEPFERQNKNTEWHTCSIKRWSKQDICVPTCVHRMNSKM